MRFVTCRAPWEVLLASGNFFQKFTCFVNELVSHKGSKALWSFFVGLKEGAFGDESSGLKNARCL